MDDWQQCHCCESLVAIVLEKSMAFSFQAVYMYPCAEAFITIKSAKVGKWKRENYNR